MKELIKRQSEKYLEKKIDRRDFLRSVVAGGLATPAAYALLSALDTQEAEAHHIRITTQAVGEETGGGSVTTQAVGEEGGRNDQITTFAVGEEDRIISSSRRGEEDGRATTMVVGEEDGVVTTGRYGEDGLWLTSMAIGEEDGSWGSTGSSGSGTSEINLGGITLRLTFGN